MPKSYMGYSKQITCFSTENAKKCSSKVISNSFNQGNSEILFVNLVFLTQKRMSLVLVFGVNAPVNVLFSKNMITNQMSFLFIEFNFCPREQRKSNCENHFHMFMLLSAEKLQTLYLLRGWVAVRPKCSYTLKINLLSNNFR